MNYTFVVYVEKYDCAQFKKSMKMYVCGAGTAADWNCDRLIHTLSGMCTDEKQLGGKSAVK